MVAKERKKDPAEKIAKILRETFGDCHMELEFDVDELRDKLDACGKVRLPINIFYVKNIKNNRVKKSGKGE